MEKPTADLFEFIFDAVAKFFDEAGEPLTLGQVRVLNSARQDIARSAALNHQENRS